MRLKTRIDESDVIKVVADSNPKRNGSKSRFRFACYRDGMSVAEYRQAVGRERGDYEAGKCTLDLRWDSERHYIRIERNGRPLNP